MFHAAPGGDPAVRWGVSKRRMPSIAWPVSLGATLMALVIGGIVLWNVGVFGPAARRPWRPDSWLDWAYLLVGNSIFLLVIAGLVVFVVFWARQVLLNRRQQNFIDAVTHELKSPLTSLRLHLETLQLRRLDPERVAAFAGLMLEDVARLDALVDDVLAAARGQAPEQAAEPVALAPIVASACAQIRERHGLPEDALRLEPEPESERLGVRLSEPALRSVLMNLLDNAVKYSPGHVEITVRYGPRGSSRVRLSVSDRGQGIPKALQRRVFQRFYRTGAAEASRRRGLGLGLALVKETLKRAGGRIMVESEGEGRGATFSIDVPGGPLGAHLAG